MNSEQGKIEGSKREKVTAITLDRNVHVCTQITAAAPRLRCSVFMMRRANSSMGIGIVWGIEVEGMQ